MVTQGRRRSSHRLTGLARSQICRDVGPDNVRCAASLAARRSHATGCRRCRRGWMAYTVQYLMTRHLQQLLRAMKRQPHRSGRKHEARSLGTPLAMTSPGSLVGHARRLLLSELTRRDFAAWILTGRSIGAAGHLRGQPGELAPRTIARSAHYRQRRRCRPLRTAHEC